MKKNSPSPVDPDVLGPAESNMEPMARHPMQARIAALVLLAPGVIGAIGQQPLQSQNAPVGTSADRPLPDVVKLMRDVEVNQRKSEAIEKNYIYHSVATEQEYDSHGQVKKTKITESDHFWLSGVPVRRMTKKDGRALTPDEMTQENERIDKLAAKSNERRDKADAEGKQTNARGDEEVSVSRLIELGAFTNARRVIIEGRDTIAVDFTGDPHAKTRNRAEEVIRDLAGTAWIDEQDHVLARVEGHFANSFKIAGGLVASAQKGHQLLDDPIEGEQRGLAADRARWTRIVPCTAVLRYQRQRNDCELGLPQVSGDVDAVASDP